MSVFTILHREHLKMSKIYGPALAALLLVSACEAPGTEEQRGMIAQDKDTVLSALASDLDLQSNTLVAACIAGLEGRAPNDTRLTKPPFSKSSNGGTVVYSGQWSGQHSYNTGGTLLEVDPTECRFPSVDLYGMAQPATRPNEGFVIGPRPEISRELEKTGYRVSEFTPVSLGGTFMRGALGGLTPGGVQRALEGTLTATKAGQTLKVEVFAFKEKSNLGVVGTLVTIGRP
jgi:hypothetical protein